jgi:hypothetical protein
MASASWRSRSDDLENRRPPPQAPEVVDDAIRWAERSVDELRTAWRGRNFREGAYMRVAADPAAAPGGRWGGRWRPPVGRDRGVSLARLLMASSPLIIAGWRVGGNA